MHMWHRWQKHSLGGFVALSALMGVLVFMIAPSDAQESDKANAAKTEGKDLHKEMEAVNRALGRLPRRLVVIGVEGARFEAGAGPSAGVRAAMDAAANEVLAQL